MSTIAYKMGKHTPSKKEKERKKKNKKKEGMASRIRTKMDVYSPWYDKLRRLVFNLKKYCITKENSSKIC